MAQQRILASRRDRFSQAFALSAVAAAVGLALSGPAYSQDSQNDEILVTGTRIARTSGFTTAVPVTAVTADDLTGFQPGRTIADQLDQLPQFFATQSAQRGGGALFGQAGISTINMRAMGPQRTLVLLDGARVSPADRDGSVNVDNFPTALLQQVEVVTGGASAAYGADALAGVANFRINHNYEGFDLNVGAGRTSAGFGDQQDLSAAFGTKFGERWHFVGSLETQNIDPIDPDPSELGGWFRRYGIVANPASTAANGATQPQRLVLPDVNTTLHSPTGRIGAAANAAGGAATLTLANGPSLGQNFNYQGTALVPFVAGNVVGTATSNQSGGPEAAIANLAFNTPIYGAEVRRRNVFAGLTFDANDTTRFMMNLFAGETESNDHHVRGIPHLSGIWNGRLYVTNPYLPASVRTAMTAQGVDSFVFQKQGTVEGQPGNWNEDEERHNEFDSWTLQLGLDKEIGSNWTMQARVQRGETDRYSTVYNEVRVDREFLAIDAVEVFNDRRDLTGDNGAGGPDGRPDLVPIAQTGTGTIICNVQRYNPTAAQLQASVSTIRVPAPQGDDSLGGPTDLVPIPGPVGPDAIPNCVPMNVLGQGNVSPAAHNYAQSQKEGVGTVTQEFAEVVFSGDIWKGFGPGAFSMAGGMTYRDQSFWQRGLPQSLMAYGPPQNAPTLGIRGFPAGFTGGSPNLHEFSTVPVITGSYHVWEAFTEFNLPLWQAKSGKQRLELDVAGRNSDYSTSGTIISYKTGINFQMAEAWRLRATASRDVREPTFAERFNLQGGGGQVFDPLLPANSPATQITTTTGGNPLLDPERADTQTIGIVFAPSSIGLQVSVDYYDIDMSGAIGTVGVQNIANACYNLGRQSQCQYITRDPNTQVITQIRDVQQNINAAKVRGIDYELVFNTEPNFAPNKNESLTFRFLAGRLLEDSNTLLGGAAPDYRNIAGRWFEPDVKLLANVRYGIGPWGINLQERYIPETRLDGGFAPVQSAGVDNPNWVQWEPGMNVGTLPTGTFTIDDNTVQSKAYTDLILSYTAEMRTGHNWEASLSVSNAFDVDPPIIPSFDTRFSSQTVSPNNFDLYGRRYLLNFKYSF
ncbi:MAG TPA: TonB-dependent receptor [Gammaproteobacteria bacterium]|nr:TonB-dependent receptor [Gammaproteobacteria bacterium]